MSWPTVVLGDYVSELRGGASIKGEEFTDSGFPVLHKGTIREGAHLVFERDGKSHVPTEYADAKIKAIVDSRYIVATFRNLVRTGETLGFMAPVPDGQEFLLAQGAYGLKLDEDKLDKRFLSHLSNAWIFHKEVLKRMVGTTQVHIRNSEFLKIPIPLPPLPEQKRIAASLDAADALRAKRRESIQQLDALIQSTFIGMFGDPVTNPMGWETATIEEVCERVIDCPHSTPKWSKSGVICLRTSNLGKGEWDWTDTRYVTEEDHIERTKRSDIEVDDIILSREGTVGVLALVTKSMRVCMGQRLVQLRVKRSLLYPKFVLHLLLQDLAPDRLKRLMAGSTSKHLNVKDLRKLRVLLPPLQLQREFEKVVEGAEHQKARLGAHAKQLDSLFESLQSRAFAGEL